MPSISPPLAPSRLAVVLGTWNRLDSLRRCLASIARETRTAFVVHVTDAGSTDGTVEFLRAEMAAGRLVAHLVGKKIGQAQALNAVFAQLATPYVCWLSDDNEVVGGGLDVAVRTLETEERVGLVALKVRDVEGPFVEAPYIGGVSSAGVLNVNQGMLPARVLRVLGGFSEAFVDYGIDPDLTARVLFGGWKIVYTRQVCLHHYRQWADERDPAGQAVLQAKHDRYYRLYDQLYGARGGRGPGHWWWRQRRRLWERHSGFIKSLPWLCGESSLLRMNARDWMNLLKARYIRLSDPLWTWEKPFHLVQDASDHF